MKQHYRLSKQILQEITESQNILINVHRNPDLDSIGSATALYQALIKIFGKSVTLVCPHEIPENFKFLKGSDKVKTIDFKNLSGDLFLILDSGSYDIVTGSKEIQLPNIKKIIIDHHQTNNWTEFIHKLLDIEASSTSEIVYKMFLDWEIEIDPEMATSLFSGIASDTVFFKYEKNSKKTFRIATELLEKGANKDKLIEQAFDSFDFNLIQTMGEFLTKMKKETSPAGEFVYSIMDYETFVKFGKHRGARETAANLFARSIKGFDFGFIAVEYEEGKFAVSFRSKKDTDVSVIAKKLGGGGHKNAAGATVYGNIDQVIKKIKEAV